MAYVDLSVERANSLRREIARQEAARKRLDDSLVARKNALRRLETQTAMRSPASPLPR